MKELVESQTVKNGKAPPRNRVRSFDEEGRVKRIEKGGEEGINKVVVIVCVVWVVN